MRKRQRNRLILFALVIGIGVYVIILNMTDQQNLIGGDWASITSSTISYLPSLIGVGVGLTLIIRDSGNYNTTPIRILVMTGLTGISLSGLFYEMYDDGIWVNDVITTSFTITDFQLVLVIASLLLGVILGLSKR